MAARGVLTVARGSCCMRRCMRGWGWGWGWGARVHTAPHRIASQADLAERMISHIMHVRRREEKNERLLRQQQVRTLGMVQLFRVCSC